MAKLSIIEAFLTNASNRDYQESLIKYYIQFNAVEICELMTLIKEILAHLAYNYK